MEVTIESETANPVEVVTAHDFAGVRFEQPLFDAEDVAAWRLSSIYFRAARETEAAGDACATRVYRLLGTLCDIVLRPEDRANVWGAKATGTSWRLALPGDFKGEQTEVLRGLLPSIKHPSLRARLSDIVWTNRRDAINAANYAVEAYCECIDGLLGGRFAAEVPGEGRASLIAAQMAHRALQIAHATSKKLPGSKQAELPERVKATLRAVYDVAKREAAFVVFCQTAELGLYYNCFDTDEVAADAEAVGKGGAGSYPMAAKRVWDLGASLSKKLDDKEAYRRCQLGSLDQILAMRSQVSTSGAEAYWVMEALQAIRHIEGMEQKEEELLRELRRLQRASMKEFATFSVPLDVEDDRQRVEDAFGPLNLASSLLQFALLAKSPDPAALRAEALETLERSPLMAMFGGMHVDDEGKFVTKTPGADGQSEPDEDWFRKEIDRAEDIRRLHLVAGFIDPARLIIHQKFDVQEQHFLPIVSRSPLVPRGQEHLLALGFARFFQGDFMSSAHLLIPQLEPCLRHILKVAGHDPAKRFDDATEEDRDLGGMLAKLRPELEHIFGAPIVAEIEAIFHARPGPALRHEMAHGKISAGACFHHTIIYANWLLYRLCCLFVVSDWKTIIEPAIDAEG